MAKIVLCSTFVVVLVLQIILTAIKKTNRLFTALSSIVELIIESAMLTLDIVSDDDLWIVWLIYIVVDVTSVTRKIMKDKLTIQALKGMLVYQQNMINLQHMVIVEQQLDINNSNNKAGTERER